MTQSRTVPELRFPGLEGKTSKMTLLEVCNGEISNGVFNDPGKREGAYLLVNVLNMFGSDQVDVSSLSVLALERKEFEKNKVKYGDIFFTRSSLVPAGIAWSNVFLSHEENVTYDGHLMKISPDLDRFSPAYLAQYFRSRPIRKQLIVRGKTGTMTTIGQTDIASVELNVPALPEQRKIADFLTAVDGRIAQLSQKKALLEDYKKGVMQQLFTQALRFKDDHGNEFPDWEERTLGEVSDKVGSGKTPKGGEQIYQTFGVKFIRSQNVSGNRLDLTNVTFISEEINAEMKGTEVWPLDVLLNITGASIGRTCVVPENFDRGNVNQHVCIIRPNKDALNPVFLQMFLSSGFGQKLIEQGQSGSGREGLNFQSIRSFKVPFPALPEQIKIADFLTAIDLKINSVTHQITHTQTFKKGLLQQMFV